MLTGVTTLVAFSLALTQARAAADYTGFFSQRDLAKAGWSACADPLTWSVDVTGMTQIQARGEVARLKRAWAAWSAASGMSAEYDGRVRVAFDPFTNGLRPLSEAPRSDRHVYIAFKTRSQVPIMGRSTVGLAMPTMVMMPTQEIVGGMAIFRRGYVQEQRSVAPHRLHHLYLHELGHVLGLGHARGMDNVMHPTLGELTSLGAGDQQGIRAFTQECPTSPGSAVIR